MQTRLTRFLFTALFGMLTVSASADDSKPNILMIMGDDIGYWNISAFHNGVMGYDTPTSTDLPGKVVSS